MTDAMSPGARALGLVAPAIVSMAYLSIGGCGPAHDPARMLPVYPDNLNRTWWVLPVRQPDGFVSPSPQQCGECHPDQLEDWKTTVHARAASPGLLGQLISMSPTGEVGCQLCHQPLEAQQRFREHGELEERERTVGFAERSMVEDKLIAYRRGRIELDDNPAYQPELAAHGVTCVACHVRAGKVYGPPKGEKAPRIIRDRPSTHNETIRSPYFESVNFCAECHQFTMKNRAGDKPLQNTYVEVVSSVYGQNKVACVYCHMPERRHIWRGIHDPDMVRGALGAESFWEIDGGEVIAIMTLLNQGGGHMMPTYVTPRLVAHLQLLDTAGEVVVEETYVIERKVVPGSPWKEVSDTRLPPLVPVEVVVRAPVAEVAAMRQWVDVDPDHFYRGVYDRLLARSTLGDAAREMIEKARADTDTNRYVVHDYTEEITVE